MKATKRRKRCAAGSEDGAILPTPEPTRAIALARRSPGPGR